MTQQNLADGLAEPIAALAETARALDADTQDCLRHYATLYLAPSRNTLSDRRRRSHAYTSLLCLLGACEAGPAAQHWSNAADVARTAGHGSTDSAMTALATAVLDGEAGAA